MKKINFNKIIYKNFERSEKNFKKLKKKNYLKIIQQASIMLINAIENGNKIMFCGNGGSAGDSQHLAAELIGKYLKIRNPLPAISLTTNTSTLTSISNDMSFKETFSRQVEAFGKKGDVLFAISTSGKSQNIIFACKQAKKMKIKTVLLTGMKLKKSIGIDLVINTPDTRVDRIQEMHIAIGHSICETVENYFF